MQTWELYDKYIAISLKNCLNTSHYLILMKAMENNFFLAIGIKKIIITFIIYICITK